MSTRTNLTPVTLESFVKWKKRKLREKAEAAKEENANKKDKAKSGQTTGLSGREMFLYDSNMMREEVKYSCSVIVYSLIFCSLTSMVCTNTFCNSGGG